eukprot:356335-Chlamydomonas_euryale.AAC.2
MGWYPDLPTVTFPGAGCLAPWGPRHQMPWLDSPCTHTCAHKQTCVCVPAPQGRLDGGADRSAGRCNWLGAGAAVRRVGQRRTPRRPAAAGARMRALGSNVCGIWECGARRGDRPLQVSAFLAGGCAQSLGMCGEVGDCARPLGSCGEVGDCARSLGMCGEVGVQVLRMSVDESSVIPTCTIHPACPGAAPPAQELPHLPRR